MDERCRAIKEARRVIEAYKAFQGGKLGHPILVLSAAPKDTTAPAEGIIRTISELHNIPIETKRVSTGPHLHGYFLRYKHGVRIVYSADMDISLGRFVLCKEAAHVFLGNADNQTASSDDALQLMSALLNEFSESSTPAQDVEQAAYFAAIELLLPQEFLGRVRELKEHGCSDLDISRSFLIPEKLVEFRFGHPQIREIFERAYNNDC